MAKIVTVNRRPGWAPDYQPIPGNKLIGVTAADLQHLDSSSGGSTQSTLTETTFDTISDTNAAHILLTNSAGGGDVTLKSVVIKARPVHQIGGDAGYIHDAFRDDDDIARSGEKLLQIASDNIMIASQLNAIAEWAWKNGHATRHTYQCSLLGSWPELQLGQRYQLSIGGPGEAEYVDSVVRCYRIVETIGRNGADTIADFYEIEEGFKFDSNSLARFLASGHIADGVTQNMFVVGARLYNGQAISYCDGTDDETEINAAIQYVSTVVGGGIVYLPEGTYNIDTASVVMASNVTLQGSGNGTILSRNFNTDKCVKAEGGSGTELTNVWVRDMQVTRTGSIGSHQLVLYKYVDDSSVSGLRLVDPDGIGLYLQYCDRVNVDNINVTGQYLGGVEVAACDSINLNNIVVGASTGKSTTLIGLTVDASNAVNLNNIAIRGLSTSGVVWGVELVNSSSVRVSNLSIVNLDTSHGSSDAVGLFVSISNSSFSNISVEDVDSTTAAQSRGIKVLGDDNVFSSISVTGCSGTGVVVEVLADDTMIVGGRSTSNGTNYTDSSATTDISSFRVT